jgi:hypothetical protein
MECKCAPDNNGVRAGDEGGQPFIMNCHVGRKDKS